MPPLNLITSTSSDNEEPRSLDVLRSWTKSGPFYSSRPCLHRFGAAFHIDRAQFVIFIGTSGRTDDDEAFHHSFLSDRNPADVLDPFFHLLR